MHRSVIKLCVLLHFFLSLTYLLISLFKKEFLKRNCFFFFYFVEDFEVMDRIIRMVLTCHWIGISSISI